MLDVKLKKEKNNVWNRVVGMIKEEMQGLCCLPKAFEDGVYVFKSVVDLSSHFGTLNKNREYSKLQKLIHNNH